MFEALCLFAQHAGDGLRRSRIAFGKMNGELGTHRTPAENEHRGDCT